MVRRALFAAVAVAAALAGAAAAVLVLGGRGTPETLPQLDGRAVAARATVEPGAHLFGDAVSAHVDALVDRARVDPAALRLDASFAPYQPVGPVRVERRDVGGLTHLRYTVPLRCLTGDCVPPLAKRAFTFAPGALAAGDRRLVSFEWPPVEATSRVNQSELVPQEAIIQLNWRANMTELPAVSYRLEPQVAAAALVGLSGLLAAAAGALVFAALRRTAPAPPLSLLPPLERSLALLAAARRRDDAAEERKALDLLAAELGRRGEDALARAASELAWSPRAPAGEATAALAERVRRIVEQGRNGDAP